MNDDNTQQMTLVTPPAWENFGQWVIYGIVAFMTLVVLVFLIKLIFPGKDKDDE